MARAGSTVRIKRGCAASADRDLPGWAIDVGLRFDPIVQSRRRRIDDLISAKPTCWARGSLLTPFAAGTGIPFRPDAGRIARKARITLVALRSRQAVRAVRSVLAVLPGPAGRPDARWIAGQAGSTIGAIRAVRPRESRVTLDALLVERDFVFQRRNAVLHRRRRR